MQYLKKKQLSRARILLSVIMMHYALSTTQAIAAPSCDQVLGACDAALKARKEEVRLCDLALKQANGNSTQLTAQVSDLNAKLESPFRNPFIMTTVGVVVGILVGGFALRK